MKILDYREIHFSYGIHGYSIFFRGWKLDFENQTAKSEADIIHQVVNILLKNPKCLKHIVSNEFL